MFPFVQEQWLNISHLNFNQPNIYSILYFFSGFLIPIFISIISYKNFLSYEFNKDIKYNERNKIKYLFYPLIIILFILSYLLMKYFIIIPKLIIPYSNYSTYSESITEIILLIIILILLIFKKSREMLKRYFLLNYFILSSLIWSLIYFDYYSEISFFNYSYLYELKININNVFIVNIFYLLIVETFYYLWSYLSFDKNLSDWSVPIPTINNLIPILKIFIYYFGFINYYFILKSNLN